MNVYICYEVVYNPGSTDIIFLEKVVDSEEKALEWVSEAEPTTTSWPEWRKYECFKVE